MLISGKSSLKSPVITGEGEQAAGIVFDVGCLGIIFEKTVATVIVYNELARPEEHPIFHHYILPVLVEPLPDMRAGYVRLGVW